MRAALAALILVPPIPAVAQVAPVEREMSTDRPDKTESPYTVPAGRIQIEMDLANSPATAPMGPPPRRPGSRRSI